MRVHWGWVLVGVGVGVWVVPKIVPKLPVPKKMGGY